ncbi:MAG TPA: hypothetical protein PKK26_01230 [Candidatus Wallbacteria bacterium]|nr:hypothetical protein [Candidatus Wallbacteria bacterium]
MTKKNKLNTTILMACIISFAFVGMFYETSQASIKHLVIGGIIGAGAVLAWPTITGAVASIAGAAVAGGAAVTSAVAVGGAAVGGAVAGAGAAVGGAITGGFAAIGGAVAAITASPLFLPILAIVAVAVVGYFVYKHFKNKAAKTPTTTADNPYDSTTTTGRITDSTTTTTTATTDKNTTPTTTTAADTTVSTPTTQSVQDSSAKSYKDKYTAAYQNYIKLLQTDTSNGTSAEIMQAFQQLKQAQDEYKNYLDSNPAAASK